MMIKILAIGKLKETYWIDAIAEYQKRLNKWIPVQVIEIKEETTSDINKNKEKEGLLILSSIESSDYVITLEINGLNIGSEKLAHLFEERITYGNSNIVIVIGGSDGLSNEVSLRSNYALSFGKQTFPHQMIRVMLFEQLYRAFSIIHHQKYHK